MTAVAAVTLAAVVVIGVAVAVAVARRAVARAVTALRGTTVGATVERRLRRAVAPPHAPLKATAVAVAWMLAVIAIGWLLGVVSGLGPQPVALPGDQPVLSWFATGRARWLTEVMRAVTWLGDSTVLVSATMVIGLVWRWRRGSWRALLVGLGAYGGAALTFNVVKRLTDRPRPPAALSLMEPAGSAYPSGHAVDAAAVYLAVAVLAAWVLRRRLLAVVVGVAAAAVTMVVISRLYLAVHWLSDVVAGAIMGVLWTAGLVATLSALWQQPPASRRRSTGW